MIIDEAIYRLNDLEAIDKEIGLDKDADAIRLGIEALNRLKEQRSRTALDEYDFLPSETKD